MYNLSLREGILTEIRKLKMESNVHRIILVTTSDVLVVNSKGVTAQRG